ncbi:MAG: DUF4249 domain-containing protein [Bacteroidales bacterium]|nr:DUF4249 domain-containing protein [Bacteroidales bacterium]
MRVFFIIFLLVFIFSCEKEIDLKLPAGERKPVIEGAIETGEYAWVFVTYTSPYFSKFDSTTIFNMIETKATVIVSDGIEYDTLKPVIDIYTFPFFKYKGSRIKGAEGKTYFLKVIIDGKEYTAQTTIPYHVKVDSLKFRPDENVDTLGFIWLYLKDPDTAGNYYRGFTKVLGKDSIYLHPFPSVFDDRYFNGKSVEYELYRGRNPLEDNKYNEQGLDSSGVGRWYFRVGETVVVKICQIDYAHYCFWYSVEQQYITDSNPFATPTSLKSNIKGGAIGIWGGYAPFYDTIKITKP